MKRSLLLTALCTLASGIPLHAVAAPRDVDGTAGKQQAAADLSISAVTPISFSLLDGTLRGDITGSVSGTRPVHLFAINSAQAKVKLSPLRFGGDRFRVSAQVDLNSLLDNGTMTFFVSPSEDGSHEPSAPSRFQPNIVLTAPVITTAVGGRRRANVAGTAMRGARVQVTLAGASKQVIATWPSGDWHAVFDNVAEGEHEVSAKVVDVTNTFPASTATTTKLVAEGDITRPLYITTPAPGASLTRRVSVAGVASPERGSVLVSLGGGEVVQAQVNRVQQTWNATVKSASHGSVPLVARLADTGELVSYNVDVAPFGDPIPSRFEMKFDRAGKRQDLLAEGTVNLAASDIEVQYRTRNGDLATLAAIDEEGHWRYQGEKPRDMRLSGGRIDGLRYHQIAELSVPSNSDPVRVPVLWAAPELTSPLRVGSEPTLTGVNHSMQARIKVTLPDGRSFRALSNANQTWSIPIGPLPIGRTSVELSADVPEVSAHNFQTSHYVLDVVASP